MEQDIGASPPGDPAALLRWYIDAGVDVVLTDAPVDQYAVSASHLERLRQRALTPDGGGGRPQARGRMPGRPGGAGMGGTGTGGRAGGGRMQQAPPDTMGEEPPTQAETLRAAAHLAAEAHSLEALRAALDAFHSCALRRTATNTVFADGAPDSGVMIIGEAPGADEDRLGLPFVGVSGKLLDLMLNAVGLDRQTAYITNVVPWRPPGNRKPTADEVALCLPFLERHVELIQPKALLLVGGLSAQSLLARTEGITRLRGRWGEVSLPGLSRPVPALATFHPAYLLRSPAQKRLAWRDMLAFRERLDQT